MVSFLQISDEIIALELVKFFEGLANLLLLSFRQASCITCLPS